MLLKALHSHHLSPRFILMAVTTITTTHAHPASVATIKPHPSSSAISRLQSSHPPAVTAPGAWLDPAFQTIRSATQVEPIAIRIPAEAQVPALPLGLAQDAGAFVDRPPAVEEAQIAVGHALFDLPESAGHRSSSVLDLQVIAGDDDIALAELAFQHELIGAVAQGPPLSAGAADL
jgi:hypothetical protein